MTHTVQYQISSIMITKLIRIRLFDKNEVERH